MKFCFLALFNFLFLFASAQEGISKNIYDFKVAAATGGTIDLSAYRGKKILIVNTPIHRTNSRQYSELEKLYQQYKDRLVIIGVLANDFLIEPGSKKDGQPDVRNYRVTFPLASKLIIRGDKMAPLFKWLTDKNYNGLQDTEVKWDFQKFLIRETGTLVAVFDPIVRYTDPELIAAIGK